MDTLILLSTLAKRMFVHESGPTAFMYEHPFDYDQIKKWQKIGYNVKNRIRLMTLNHYIIRFIQEKR